MSKPQGYRQTAAEGCFFLLVLCFPYWQSVLLAAMSGTLSVLLLSCLLMFVVVRSPEISRAITAYLHAFPPSWVVPVPDRKRYQDSTPFFAIDSWPSFAPSFQRPPPIFS